jgi:hypothetical protein
MLVEIAMRCIGLSADADGGQHPEIAPAPSKRDRVVNGTAAGIQHDGRAAELSAAREFIEISWSICSYDADRAYPAAAIRLARDPAELHRQFAFSENDAGMRRTGQHSHQCDAKGGDAILTSGLNDPLDPFSRGRLRKSIRSACKPPFHGFEGSSPMYRLSTSSGQEAHRT